MVCKYIESGNHSTTLQCAFERNQIFWFDILMCWSKNTFDFFFRIITDCFLWINGGNDNLTASFRNDEIKAIASTFFVENWIGHSWFFNSRVFSFWAQGFINIPDIFYGFKRNKKTTNILFDIFCRFLLIKLNHLQYLPQ